MCKKVTKNNIEATLLEWDGFQAQLNTLIEKQNAEIIQIQKKYQANIEKMTKEIGDRFDAVQKYAEENKANLFPDKARSLAVGSFTFGFRKNPDSINIADEKATIALLKKNNFTACYKVVETVLKPAVKELSDADKKKCKVETIVGEDVFFLK